MFILSQVIMRTSDYSYIMCSSLNNSEKKKETQLHVTQKNVGWLRKIKPESDCNLFGLFNWLNTGPWESLFQGTFQSLAIILFIVVILTSLVRCILSRVLNAFLGSHSHTRIRQLEELNDDRTNDGNSGDVTLCPDDSASGNSDYVFLRPDYIGSGNWE